MGLVGFEVATQVGGWLVLCLSMEAVRDGLGARGMPIASMKGRPAVCMGLELG